MKFLNRQNSLSFARQIHENVFHYIIHFYGYSLPFCGISVRHYQYIGITACTVSITLDCPFHFSTITIKKMFVVREDKKEFQQNLMISSARVFRTAIQLSQINLNILYIFEKNMLLVKFPNSFLYFWNWWSWGWHWYNLHNVIP